MIKRLLTNTTSYHNITLYLHASKLPPELLGRLRVLLQALLALPGFPDLLQDGHVADLFRYLPPGGRDPPRGGGVILLHNI